MKAFCASLLVLTVSAFSCGGGGGSGSGGSSCSGGAGTGSGGRSGTGGGTATGGAGGGTSSVLQEACRAFCASEGVHNCHMDPTTTVEECMSYRCAPAGTANSRESPASCASAWTAYYKCLTAQQAAGTPNPDNPAKPGCQEPGACTAEATAFEKANCP